MILFIIPLLGVTQQVHHGSTFSNKACQSVQGFQQRVRPTLRGEENGVPIKCLNQDRTGPNQNQTVQKYLTVSKKYLKEVSGSVQSLSLLLFMFVVRCILNEVDCQWTAAT